jgi:hypothetical protein
MPPDRLDVVRVDPFFNEKQRNQYASRGVAFIVLLNGAAAIVLLAILALPSPSTAGLKAIADAMLVFSVGAVLGLASALIAYLNRTLRLDQPDMTWRLPLRWLAVAAALAGATCFLVGMNMARIAVLPEASTSSRKESLRSKSQAPQRQRTEPEAAKPPPTQSESPQTPPAEPEAAKPPPTQSESPQTPPAEPEAAKPPQTETPQTPPIEPKTEPQETEPREL